MKKSNFFKKDTIKRDILIISLSIVGVLIFFNLLILYEINKEREEFYNSNLINKVRIKVKASLDLSKEIINGENSKDKLIKELNGKSIKLNLVDLKGDSIFRNSDIYEENDDMYMDYSFKASNKKDYKVAFPIIINKEQKANAVFYLPYEEFFKENIYYKVKIKLIVIIESLFILTLVIVLHMKLKKKVIKPIKELNVAAKRIKKGDYDFKISFGDSTELGEFKSSFEFMRSELHASLQKQKELEVGRKELIAAISHDIRTPVASISAYVEVLKKGVIHDEKKVNKYLNTIYNKTQELTNLTNDLFTHSQLEARKLSIDKKEVYFKSFIEELLNNVTEEIRYQNKTFEIVEVPNCLVYIDTVRIGQVILNLIENSKKYSEKDGLIRFSAKLLEDKILLFIEDDGIGIKAEDMPYIFDKFYRGEKSRNKAYGGAGLGLSICKSIVEAHGGEIWVESYDGKGTKVYFTIPIVDNYL